MRCGQGNDVEDGSPSAGAPATAAAWHRPMSTTLSTGPQSHCVSVFTGSADEDPERERQLALGLLARRVDGLVVMPSPGDPSYLRPEIDLHTPIVAVDRPPRGITVDTVMTDNAQGARSAWEDAGLPADDLQVVDDLTSEAEIARGAACSVSSASGGFPLPGGRRASAARTLARGAPTIGASGCARRRRPARAHAR